MKEYIVAIKGRYPGIVKVKVKAENMAGAWVEARKINYVEGIIDDVYPTDDNWS